MALSTEQKLEAAKLYHLNWTMDMKKKEDETGKVEGGKVWLTWQELLPEKQQEYIERVERFELCLLKMELVVIPQSSFVPPDMVVSNKADEIEVYLREFIGKLKQPKGMADLFPYEELARRIVLRFGGEKK